MYKELTIENIKTFEKEQKLKLRPITLLYGENSSGKTTLLKTFDIVHNIFAEYHVKERGKNISEKKDIPFYKNENIQNISAKKIHYFSSQINQWVLLKYSPNCFKNCVQSMNIVCHIIIEWSFGTQLLETARPLYLLKS